MNVEDVIVLGGVDPGRADGKTQVGPGSFGEAIHRVMRDMDVAIKAIAFHGDPDRDFLAMMIPHDKAAVEMARLVLLHGRDPIVRQLAEDIIAHEPSRIAGMGARLGVLAPGGKGSTRRLTISATEER